MQLAQYVKNAVANLKGFGQRLTREEAGVTAIEYGLIAALIAVAIIASVKLVGENLVVVFEKVAEQLGFAVNPPPPAP